MEFEVLKKGVVKRTQKRALGLFIDGTGLDRATRRINRKVDMASLVRGVTSGSTPVVARYYTLIPFEDDSRHRAFLDAVTRAGLTVVVKRLPPKGITRQVSVDLEMAADIVAFALGHSAFSSEHEYRPEEQAAPAPRGRGSALPSGLNLRRQSAEPPKENAESPEAKAEPAVDPLSLTKPENRVVTVVCPSRELAYPIALIKDLRVDTITADFGQFNTGDVLKSAAKWIDLSDSETIWRD